MALNHEDWAVEYQGNRTMQSLTEQELADEMVAAAIELKRAKSTQQEIDDAVEHWTHCMEECILRGNIYSDYVHAETLEAL